MAFINGHIMPGSLEGVNGGGGGGPQAQTSTLIVENGQLDSNTWSVDSGKYLVKITNKGMENLTVNSATVSPGNSLTIKAVYNPVTNEYALTPQLIILNPQQTEFWYEIHS